MMMFVFEALKSCSKEWVGGGELNVAWALQEAKEVAPRTAREREVLSFTLFLLFFWR